MIGRCHCGRCSFVVESPKTFRFSCHCEDCRALSSGGRFLGISVNADCLTNVDGPIGTYSYPGGSGKPIVNTFCSLCATRLFNHAESHADFVNIMAMSLDNWEAFEPRKFLYTDHALVWDRTDLET